MEEVGNQDVMGRSVFYLGGIFRRDSLSLVYRQ